MRKNKARIGSSAQELSHRLDGRNKVILLSLVAFQAKEIAPDEWLKFGY